jgi:hypothetical protein
MSLEGGRGPQCTVSASAIAFETQAGKVDVREVRVHNTGSHACAFEWLHAPRHTPLATPTAVAARRCFGLRECKGRLAPGATAACTASFASDSPGIFHDRCSRPVAAGAHTLSRGRRGSPAHS